MDVLIKLTATKPTCMFQGALFKKKKWVVNLHPDKL